jgi:hypothetical protein
MRRAERGRYQARAWWWPLFFCKGEINAMARIRTIPKAVEEMKQKDPNTCINITGLRRWVKAGRIRSFDGGKSPLVDLDELERMVTGGAYADC